MKKAPPAGQMSMKNFFGAPEPKPAPAAADDAAPMHVDESTQQVASKRPLELEGKASKRMATEDRVDTPTQSLSTPLARTEAASKRPSSASDGSEPSSANASAVSEAIQASSERREPSPLS